MAARPAPPARLARWTGLPGALVVLLGLRLLLQISVYQSGFRALTAPPPAAPAGVQCPLPLGTGC